MVKDNKTKFLFIIIFILLILITLTFFPENNFEKYIEMKIDRIQYVEDSAIVFLTHGCYVFSFYTTRNQGEMIEIAIKNITTQRPLTHDIIIEIFKAFDISPIYLKIERLENETYFASLVLRKHLSTASIDIRPSDGVAIAYRAKIPIYVNEKLLTNICTKAL
jgi:bifunctional DNase/RNase